MLSQPEINAAMSNDGFKGETAAALATIKRVTTSSKYSHPPCTRAYLATKSVRESTKSARDADLPENTVQVGETNRTPAFQSLYASSWRRLNKISRELFPESLPKLESCHQGAFGDCMFVSLVGSMVNRDPSSVKAMFAQGAGGTNTVTLGAGRKVVVPPLTDAELAVSDHAGTNGVWLSVLENAYRKAYSETYHTNQLAPYDAIRIVMERNVNLMTGHKTLRFKIEKPDDEKLAATIRKNLESAMSERRLVVCGTSKSAKLPPGLVANHEYAVLAFNKEKGTVRLWNPWGNTFTPKGEEGLQHGYTTKAGQFEVPFADWMQIYHGITFEVKPSEVL